MESPPQPLRAFTPAARADQASALSAVEGGQRAIFFNRIGGVQQDTILAEGLHFR